HSHHMLQSNADGLGPGHPLVGFYDLPCIDGFPIAVDIPGETPALTERCCHAGSSTRGIGTEQDSTDEWRRGAPITLRSLGKARTARMPEHLAPHGAEVERDTIGHPLVKPHLIATDSDGTIIPYSQTHTGYVSPRTLAA